MTELWLEMQNKWIFLRSALANLTTSNENQLSLERISMRFIDVDENFRVMNQISFLSDSMYVVLFIYLFLNRTSKN